MLNEIIAKKATDLFEDSYTYENHINLDDTFEKVVDDLVDDEEFMEEYELTEDELANIAWKICEEEYYGYLDMISEAESWELEKAYLNRWIEGAA